MYTGGVEFARIKRFGRWQSDAAHDYLWEAHETQKDLSQVMVGATRTLTATSARGSPAALGGRGRPSSALPSSAQPAAGQGGRGQGGRHGDLGSEGLRPRAVSADARRRVRFAASGSSGSRGAGAAWEGTSCAPHSPPGGPGTTGRTFRQRWGRQ